MEGWCAKNITAAVKSDGGISSGLRIAVFSFVALAAKTACTNKISPSQRRICACKTRPRVISSGGREGKSKSATSERGNEREEEVKGEEVRRGRTAAVDTFRKLAF